MNLPAPQSSPQILSPESEDIFSLDREVRTFARMTRTAMMGLAYYGWRLRFVIEGQGGDWSVLDAPYEDIDPTTSEVVQRPAETEDEYRETLGLSRSNWYKYLGIGQALRHLTLEQLRSITITNAELLLQVDPSIMMDYHWVKEATDLSSSAFALLVGKRNKQHGIDRQPMTYFRAKVPATAKKFLEQTVRDFRNEHQLASDGEALELLIADTHDRPNVIAAVYRAAAYIRWTRYRLRRRKPNSSPMKWLEAAEYELSRVYRLVRKEDRYAKDAEEVYPAKDEQDHENFRRWNRGVPVEPGGEGGEEAGSDEAVAGSGGDLRDLPQGIEADRSGDDVEDDTGFDGDDT